MPKPIGASGTLQQETFAFRLREAFDAAKSWGVEQKAVANNLGWDPTTLSRYKRPGYEKGPPSEARRRALERAIGIPVGYLDRPTGDLSLLRKGDARHSQHGQPPVTSEKFRGHREGGDLERAMGRSVAESWRSIILERHLAPSDVLQILALEQDWLLGQFKIRGDVRLKQAADDVEKTMDAIRELTARK